MQDRAVASEQIPQASARPMRVMSVIPESPGPASMVFAVRQSESMEQNGLDGMKFFLASRTNPRVLLQERRRLRAEIDSFRPDVVHAHFGTMTGFFCAWSSPVPVVVSYRGSDLNPAPSMSQAHWAFGFLLSQMAALRARGIICVSEPLRRRLWWRRDRVTVIPSGVETRRFFPRPLNEARTELGWVQDERIVIFNAGRTPEVKRLDLAEAAISEAEKICGSIRFVVMRGDTDPAQVAAMLNASNCLLVTSDYEGSPTIVQEAMACNVPIVTVDVGDVRERLAHVNPSRIVARGAGDLGRAVAEFARVCVRSNGADSARDVSLDTLSGTLSAVYRSAAGWSQSEPHS